MSAMPAALKARVLADCKTASARRPAGRAGPSADALLRRRELLAGIDNGYARVALRKIADANPQVTALSQVPISITSTGDLRKLSDLGERAGSKPRAREILTNPRDRAAKLSIETTRTHPITGQVLPLPPLEPWSCPVPCGMLAYAEIMLAKDDGAYQLADFTGDRLTALQWMRDEELVSISDDGRIRALSDAGFSDARAYPGAPCSDKRASVGRQLRDKAGGLILAAIMNLSSGKTVRRTRKRRTGQLVGDDGIRITGAQVCTEANRIKSRRPDLGEFRYLSLGTCRQLIRALVDMEVIEEIEPPHAVRQRRSWRMIPRVIRRLTADVLGLRPALEVAA